MILLNASWDQVKEWVTARMAKEVVVENVPGVLSNFIVELLVPHEQKEEYYICMQSTRAGDMIYFYHEGGVDVGNVDEKAEKMVVQVDEKPSTEDIKVFQFAKYLVDFYFRKLCWFISKSSL